MADVWATLCPAIDARSAFRLVDSEQPPRCRSTIDSQSEVSVYVLQVNQNPSDGSRRCLYATRPISLLDLSAGGGLLGSLIVATIGAVVLIFILRLIKRA